LIKSPDKTTKYTVQTISVKTLNSLKFT